MRETIFKKLLWDFASKKDVDFATISIGEEIFAGGAHNSIVMAQITRGVVAALVLQHACGFAPIQRARNPTRRRLGNSREQAAARPGKPDESDAIDVPFTSVPLGNYKSGSILGAVRAGQEEAAQASVGAPVGVGVLRVGPEEKTGFAAKLGEIFNPGGLPDEEPEFPTDKVANSRATVFVIPRKISQWYIYGMFGFEFLAGATAGTPAYQLRHHWIYPSFLLAAVFDHVRRGPHFLAADCSSSRVSHCSPVQTNATLRIHLFFHTFPLGI